MPVSIANSSSKPVVVTATVTVTVDQADAEQKQDASAIIAAVTGDLASIGEVIVAANTRDGATANVDTTFSFDLGFGNEVIYTDEVE